MPADIPPNERGGDGQCRARNRAGTRCRKRIPLGHLVCRNHGGATPSVLAKAKQRMAALAPDALDTLSDAMTREPACDKCGRTDSMRDALRAARIVLDRVVPATQRIELASDDEDLDEKSEEELAHLAESLATDLKNLARQKLRVAPDDGGVH